MERRWFIALIAFACAWFVGRAALAGTPSNPPYIVYEGYLEDSGGAINGTRPVSVQLVGKTTGECLLYTQAFSSVTITDGHFALKIGQGGSFYGGETSFSGLQEPRVIGGSSCTFNPNTAGAVRLLRLTVDGNLMGDVELVAAPRAMVADSVDGLGKANILQVNVSASLTQSALESFMQTITGTSGRGVTWNGSSFQSYDPKDGSALNSSSVSDAAIASVSWSKLNSKPASISTIEGLSCANGEIMKMVSGSWACATDGGGGGGSESDPTVAAYAKNAPGAGLAVSSGAIVADFGTAAGQVAQGNDARFTDARAPNGSAGGDLGSSYPNPRVVGLDGQPLSATAPAGGQILTFDTGAWRPMTTVNLVRSFPTGTPDPTIQTNLVTQGLPALGSSNDPYIFASNLLKSTNVTTTTTTYGTHAGTLRVQSEAAANSGITNNGGHAAASIEVYRNSLGAATDAGTVASLIGGRFFVGHGTANAVSPQTNEAVGIEIGGDFNSGTVGSYKAIRIQSPGGSSKPTNANTFGIYQENSNMRNVFEGFVGIHTQAPSALLHLGNGSAAPQSAPLKFTGSTMMTTPEDGAVEYDGSDLYFTRSSTRQKFAMFSGTSLTSVTGIYSTSGITLDPGSGQNVYVNSGNASFSPSTGALIVAGGVGVATDLNTGGTISAFGGIKTQSSTSATSGSNSSSPSIYLSANYWDGSNSLIDQFTITNVMGAGANPTATLKFDRNSANTGLRQYAFMNGNVGVGTTSPLGTFSPNKSYITLRGPAANGALQMSSGAGDGTNVTAGAIDFFEEATGKSLAYIQGATAATATTVNNRGGALAFFTKGDAGVSTERVRINYDGNTGFGTQVPSYKVDVNAATIGVGAKTAASGVLGGNIMMRDDSANNRWQVGIPAAASSTNFQIYDVAATTPRLWITQSTGNVGIGTNNPAQPLDVVGPIQGTAFVSSGNVQLNATSGGEIYLMRSGGIKAALRNDDYFETPKLRVVDGNQAAGKVLTSDGLGNATWTTPAASTSTFNPGRTYALQAPGNSSTLFQSGTTSAFTANPSPTSADSNTAAGVKYTSTATANYVAGVLGGGFTVRPGWNPIFEGHITLDTDVTNVNYWVGLSSGVYASNVACAGGSNCSESPYTQSIAAFRYSTASPAFDTTWMCYAANGASSSNQNSGVFVNANTTYLLRIEVTLSSIKYLINGAPVCTLSTGLPGASSAMMPHATARAISGTGKSITIHRLNIKSD